MSEGGGNGGCEGGWGWWVGREGSEKYVTMG